MKKPRLVFVAAALATFALPAVTIELRCPDEVSAKGATHALVSQECFRRVKTKWPWWWSLYMTTVKRGV